MRIIIIRHAEPDYEHNTITPRGFKEAHFLADRLMKEKIDYVYVSPLGRALDTAKEYLKRSKKPYEILDYIKEFNYLVKDELTGKEKIPWDFQVEYFTSLKHIYDQSYLKNPLFKNSKVETGYKYVTQNFSKLLKKHGYQKHKKYFKVLKENDDTLLFICHLGVECVLLSYLLNIPYVVLAQHIGFTPSSVSIIYTEERIPGIAQFRVQCLGDISHLYKNDMEPSFMGRFREKASDNTRS